MGILTHATTTTALGACPTCQGILTAIAWHQPTTQTAPSLLEVRLSGPSGPQSCDSPVARTHSPSNSCGPTRESAAGFKNYCFFFVCEAPRHGSWWLQYPSKVISEIPSSSEMGHRGCIQPRRFESRNLLWVSKTHTLPSGQKWSGTFHTLVGSNLRHRNAFITKMLP